MTRQPELLFVDRPAEVPTEQRATRFRRCPKCLRMVEASLPQCGWCGKQRAIKRAQMRRKGGQKSGYYYH